MVDVEELARFAEGLPGVAVSRHYKYMCSDPGQEMVQQDIVQQQLTRIVVAACSPSLHEPTFRRAAEAAGLNRFLVQMSNIREQVSWVTEDKADALDKAKAHLAAAVRRVAAHEPLERQFVGILPRALVVGGGIAGIEAALTLADAGREVVLVERGPSIGGHMAMFDKTFPTLDCAACILTPKMTAVKVHPKITLITNATVEAVEGSVGNYKVKIRRKSRFVDEDKCTGCGRCIERCPVLHRPYPYAAAAEGNGNGNGRGHGLPVEPELAPEMKAAIERALETHRPQGAPLISVMQDINQDVGHLPEAALRYISRSLDVPLATVYHVATFYKAFSLTPRGKHVVRVCQGTACHVRGAPRVLDALQGELAVGPGETTKDGKFTLETVNCVGTCPLAPVVVIDQKYHGNVSPGNVKKVLKGYQKHEHNGRLR
jgi:NADH:ubiquinone oxidoreductase subunit E/NAD-dependent dihydropyrimidine dehydrogenase PreA subunit